MTHEKTLDGFNLPLTYPFTFRNIRALPPNTSPEARETVAAEFLTIGPCAFPVFVQFDTDPQTFIARSGDVLTKPGGFQSVRFTSTLSLDSAGTPAPVSSDLVAIFGPYPFIRTTNKWPMKTVFFDVVIAGATTLIAHGGAFNRQYEIFSTQIFQIAGPGGPVLANGVDQVPWLTAAGGAETPGKYQIYTNFPYTVDFSGPTELWGIELENTAALDPATVRFICQATECRV